MLVLTRKVDLPLQEQDPPGGTQEVLQDDIRAVLQEDRALLLEEDLLLQRVLLKDEDPNHLLHAKDLEVQDQRAMAVPQMKREPKLKSNHFKCERDCAS